MRGDDNQQEAIFSYISPEKRVPADHPLRPIRKMVDEILKEMSQTYHRGMGSVVSAQFGQNVSDLAFNGFFADQQLISNRFVSISLCDQTQNADFSCRQSVIGGVLGQLEGGLRGKRPLPCVHGANRFE
jgi:hypothetical protein